MKRLLHLWLVLCTTLLALPAMAQTRAELKAFYTYEETGSGLQVRLTVKFANYLSDSSSDTFDYGSGTFNKATDPLPNPAPDGRYGRERVTSMKEMFMHSTAERLDCSLFDTRNVTDMESMFQYCDRLTYLDVSGFDTRNVKNMKSMFAIDGLQSDYEYKGKVITLDISNFHIAADCKIDNFISSDSYKRVFLPDLQDFGYQTVAAINAPNAVIIAMPKQQDEVAGLKAKGDASYKEVTPYSLWADDTPITEQQLEEFYYYKEVDGGVWVLPNNEFRDALDNGNSVYVGDTKWFIHDPLPNPAYGGMYKDKEVVSMEEMFSYCRASKLDASAFDTRYVKSMYKMFCQCENLQEAKYYQDIWNAENVEDMSFMFADCTSLLSVALPENTPKLKRMTNLLYNCIHLREAHLDINTSAVEDMTEVFAHCKELSRLDLSTWNTSNVFSMRNMFLDCPELQSLHIAHFDMSNVKSADEMVDSKNMETLYLPQWAEPQIEKKSEGSKSAKFYFHTPNATVFVHKGESETYKTICDIYQGEQVERWSDENNSLRFETFAYDEQGYKRMVEIQLDESALSELYTYTDYTAADGNEEMVKVGLTEAFKAAINAGNSFTCNDYTWNAGDPLPNPAPEGMYGGQKVGSMGKMFEELLEVRTLDVTNFDTRYVEDMRDMFMNCANLEEIKFSPLFATENVLSMYGCI